MSLVFPVEPDSRWREHTATAGQTVFPVNYPFQDNADITIVRVGLDGTETELSEPADYVLTGAGNPAGGSYALTVPASAGEIYRSVGTAVLDRVLSVVRNGRFNSAPIDADLDRALIRDQELHRDVSRAIKLPLGASPSVTVPRPGAGQLIGWDDAGERLVAGPTTIHERTERISADEALQSLIGQGGPIEVPYFDSVLAVTLAQVKPTFNSIRVGGYHFAGDGGDALYKRGVETPWAIQSADGAWWELAELVPNIRQCGGVGDGSTNCDNARDALIAYCIATGRGAFWPEGEYLTTTSNADFHSVRRCGPGKVKRGSDVYAVDPMPSDTNKLYIDYHSGSSSNDGLSASEPFDSFINALNALSATRNVFVGTWEFIVADDVIAGVNEDIIKNLYFTKRAILRGTSCTPASATTVGTPTDITRAADAQVTLPGHGLSNGDRVKFTGIGGMTQLNGSVATVAVVDADNFTTGIDTSSGYNAFSSGGTVTQLPIPNTVFDGTGVDDYWLTVSGGGIWLELRDIKAQNYDAAGRGGFYANDHANIYLNNYHVDNCDTGAFAQRGVIVRHSGGIIENCAAYGVKTVGSDWGVIDSALVSGPTVMNCFIGFDIQENSPAEILNTTIDGCTNIGLDSNVVSHIKTTGSWIKNCATGIRARWNSNWYGPSTIFVNNTKNWELFSGGSDQNNLPTAQDQRRIAYSSASRSHTGNTAETELSPDLFTFPSGMLDAAGKKVRVVAHGEFIPGGSPVVYSLQCYIRNFATETITSSSTSAHEFTLTLDIFLTGSAAQVMVAHFTDSLGNAKTKNRTRTHDLNQSSPLDIRATLGNSGDRVDVHYVEVWAIT